MQTTTYFLLDDQEHDVIIHGESGLRINVFSLETDRYRPSAGEIHIFGDAHGEWLAFETDGWTLEELQIISGAVLWYARYLDYPEMLITEDDPRPAERLRRV